MSGRECAPASGKPSSPKLFFCASRVLMSGPAVDAASSSSRSRLAKISVLRESLDRLCCCNMLRLRRMFCRSPCSLPLPSFSSPESALFFLRAQISWSFFFCSCLCPSSIASFSLRARRGRVVRRSFPSSVLPAGGRASSLCNDLLPNCCLRRSLLWARSLDLSSADLDCPRLLVLEWLRCREELRCLLLPPAERPRERLLLELLRRLRDSLRCLPLLLE